jgi:aminoglycoside/choline kinase family phosphotransferase
MSKNTISQRDLFQRLSKLLPKADIYERQLIPIAPDGSTRRFWRLADGDAGKEQPSVIIAVPADTSDAELAEAESAWNIGTHLASRNIAVPQLHCWDKELGILVFEDLGDSRFHDLIRDSLTDGPAGEKRIFQIYREVLQGLVAMQLDGGQDFCKSWCWDGAHYDIALMIERESDYFLSAFWQGLLAEDPVPGSREEFAEIARRAAEAPSHYFLHRDFQCRNIMITENGPKFIDFQGGRLGPLGYDLASLLIDPYACLNNTIQEELLEFYQDLIAARITINRFEFCKQYQLLALQRNLQIIGAFSFLSKVRGKVFFQKYIRPSVTMLMKRLAEPEFSDFPIIRQMVILSLRQLPL